MGCPMVETLKTGNRAHVIQEDTDGEGRVIYLDLETLPVKDQRGKIVRVIEIWRDITEDLATRWEMRLKKLKTDLGRLVQEDRMLSLGKLSASCVHEINNPIQGLLTFCNLIESMLDGGYPSKEDLDEIREHLSIMGSELERCGDIVSGLLSFARETTPDFKDVDLAESIRSVIVLTRHRIELQDISLHLDLSQESLVVKGDVNQIQQCFLNLLFNAIEAMPNGGELRLSSRLDRSRNCAQVMVRDSGCGISEEYLDNIFDPFFTTKSEGEGTGLGLSIVYGIVKSHEGEISVTSEPERGTTFTLSFPIARQAQDEPEESHD